MLRSEITATALPPTREEIARANVFWVFRSLCIVDIEAAALLELLLELDSEPCFCPCEFAADRAACLRTLWMFRLPRQPKTRARRRQRHRGGSCERGPPGDDGGSDDGDGPPGRSLFNPAGVS
jgi:hypothetical protein